MQWAQIQSLVRELEFHMWCGQKKQNENLKKKHNTGMYTGGSLEWLGSLALNHGSVIHQPCDLRQVIDNLYTLVLPGYKTEIKA